jgi:hypothetical protein
MRARAWGPAIPDLIIGRMTVSSPLPFLLHAVLRELERAYTEEGAGRPMVPSLELWANLLRVLDAAGIDHRELSAILRLSKRAVRTRVSTAVRHGWAEELKTGRGVGIVRLTARGCEVTARWKGLQQKAEEMWRAKAGPELSNTLRASLEDLVAAFPLEHPHYPASYGPADASITGGNGADWKPVHRGGGDTVSHLPLPALVSQALVAFAMQYEELSPVAFSLSTSVIRRIPAEGRPLRELGRSPGVSALIRHGFVRAIGSGGSEIAYLTPRGLEVQCAYEERIHAVETAWRRQFGEDRVTALVCALLALKQGSGIRG